MKSFKEYLLEKEEEVGQGTLNVFDIDETLFKTSATVLVVKDGKVVHKMTTQKEMDAYKLKPGEKFDFSEFRNAQTFKDSAQPIPRMLDKAKAIVSRQGNNSRTILLTARADFDDKEMFLQTFRDHGFPIDKTHVFRAGNLTAGSSAVAKMFILRKFIKSGKYRKIRVWDDSPKNLTAIDKLSSLHPEVKIETWRVLHDGSVEKHT
jgi:hypothetical protein